MDEPEVTPEPESNPEQQPGTPPPARGRGRRWKFLLLILIVLAAGGWFAWQWWQSRTTGHLAAGQSARLGQPRDPTLSATQAAASQSPARSRAAQKPARADRRTGTVQEQETPRSTNQAGAVQTQVAALGSKLDSLRSSNDSLRQRLGENAAVNHALREQMLGLSERMAQLEAALASMARQRLSAHDSMLVSEAEMLLQLGQQRYALFGDAGAALEAFALADRSLAAVGNPQFAAVRQSIAAEREALAASAPIARNHTLAALQRLRAQWPDLPLAARHQDSSVPAAGQSAWQRVWGTLSSLVQVRRESAVGSAMMTNAALARELGALSLAQAQAALLGSDMASYRAALARSASTLERAFELAAPEVQQVRAELQRLQAAVETDTVVPELGAALQQLRNMRAVASMTRDVPGARSDSRSPAPAARSTEAASDSASAPAPEPPTPTRTAVQPAPTSTASPASTPAAAGSDA